MTTKNSYVSFHINKNFGNLIIDWGDGKEDIITNVTTESFSEFEWFKFDHNYSVLAEYCITIVGDNIIGLGCTGIQLTALDVSSATVLSYLICGYNQLTALDVNRNTALKDLECDNNPLTALDVSQNMALTILSCSNIPLTALDVSKNTALTHLYCDNTQLTALDVSLNTALKGLYCYNNKLIVLDMSQNTALKSLYCSYNQLTTSALNDLFRTLPYIPGYGGYIELWGNPGELDCDHSIVEEKGWKIENDLHWECIMTCWNQWDPN